MKEEKRSILDKVTRNKHLMYNILFVLLIVTTIIPLKLPLVISDQTLNAYNLIDSLSPDSKLMFCIEITSADLAECIPMIQAIIEHLIMKEIKFIMAGFTNPEQTVLGNIALENLNAYARLEYGVDFVWLGYIPGGETTVAALAEDWTIISQDVHRTPKEMLPLLNEITHITDFDGLIIIATQSPQPEASLRHWVQRYDMEFVIGGASAHSAPTAAKWYQVGAYKGIVVAMQGAAEYEFLTNKPGFALKRLNVISFTQIAVVILMLLGFITRVLRDYRGSGGNKFG